MSDGLRTASFNRCNSNVATGNRIGILDGKEEAMNLLLPAALGASIFIPGAPIPIIGTQVIPNQTPHILLYNYQGVEVATCSYAAGTRTVSGCTLMKGITQSDLVWLYSVLTTER